MERGVYGQHPSSALIDRQNYFCPLVLASIYLKSKHEHRENEKTYATPRRNTKKKPWLYFNGLILCVCVY